MDWKEKVQNQEWQLKFLNAGTKEVGIDLSVMIKVVSEILEAQKAELRERLEKRYLETYKDNPNFAGGLVEAQNILKELLEEKV